jgi:hypothetical protein
MRKYQRKPRTDPLLITQPWKLLSVFAPVEEVLDRIERDGTIDAAGGVPVFCESSTSSWYEMVPALQGVIEFHVVARDRYRYAVDLAGLDRLRNKLDLGAPLFESDLQAARQSIVSCKQQASRLRVSQAVSIVDTVRISMALENQGVINAAHA